MLSIMSYERTAELLEEVLPLEKRISTATLSAHVQQIATRIDGELGDEQSSLARQCLSSPVGAKLTKRVG